MSLPTNAIGSFAAKPHFASLRFLYAGAGLLILLLVVTNAAVILHLRERQLLSAERELKNLSLIMAEQADRTFASVDLAISSVARAAVEGLTDAATFDRAMAGYDIHVLIREKLNGIPQLDAITILNRAGKMLNFSRFWPIPELDASGRAYFDVLKKNRSLKNYISEPVQNLANGAWTIFMAHRLSGPDGEFFGIILGAIEMRYFEDFFRAISGSEGEAISIMREDGVILARFPTGVAVGTAFYDSRHLLRGEVSGTLRELSFVDGLLRIKAAHLVSGYPVVALTSKTEQSALAEWRRVAWLMSWGALISAISIAGAGYAFGRQWQQQTTLAASEVELRRQEEHAAALTTAADLARVTATQMAYTAEHDTLTGLPNRLLLSDRIGQAIVLAQRSGNRAAVLFLDLDGFKHINDSMGHATGDKVLQSIATRLVACLRASDTVSRQGGDEFVILLSEVELVEGAAVAAGRIARAITGPHSVDQFDVHVNFGTLTGRMLQDLAEPHSIDGRDLYVNGSVGVAVFPDDGNDAETLIQNADTAMYQAKVAGSHSYRFFRPEMNVLAVERQCIEEGLRRALVAREFALYYQPVVDLKTWAITGAEAVIRWNHPTRGLISPACFISIAEECGLIQPIGRWVLREACLQARGWIDAGLPAAKIAVNVSALEFRSESFLTYLVATLSEMNLDPACLVLELTENVLMDRVEATASVLRDVRELGAQVAIDDFGTGYSSLSYLRRFPVDILKIDQSFIRQISIADEDRAIVTAVIGMAHNLNLRVIAEGVETREELAFLRTCQCDEVQGYFFSRPVSAEAFTNLLRTGIPESLKITLP